MLSLLMWLRGMDAEQTHDFARRARLSMHVHAVGRYGEISAVLHNPSADTGSSTFFVIVCEVVDSRYSTRLLRGMCSLKRRVSAVLAR
jgi:hypothetical protein